jgi:hypothetical protein
MDELPADYEGTVFLYNYAGPVREGFPVISCSTWDDVYGAVVGIMNT